MARNGGYSGWVYRAVVTWEGPDGDTRVYTYGPYATAAPARAMITRERHSAQWWPDQPTVTGRLECSEVKWAEA